MGLLDRWTKKKKQEQLEAVEKQESGVEIEKNVEDTKVAEVSKAVKKEKKEGEDKATDKKEKKETTKTREVVPAKVGRAHEILVRPIVSEKAALYEAKGIYSFIVKIKTNKVEIKKAIQEVYGVKPEKVRVMNLEGKKVRFGRQFGRRSSWKKAIIYLPKGQTIDIHEGV